LEIIPYTRDPIFQIDVPHYVPGVPQQILSPSNTWQDKTAYTQTATVLARQFCRNFEQFTQVSFDVAVAGPAES